MIVVDASVWLDLLRGHLAAQWQELIADEGCSSAPHVDFEVGAALLRLERRGALEPGDAKRLIQLFASHPVERVRQPIDAVRATDLQDNASYADAWYIALADRLDCPLLSLDDGMRKAARINRVDAIEPPAAQL